MRFSTARFFFQFYSKEKYTLVSFLKVNGQMQKREMTRHLPFLYLFRKDCAVICKNSAARLVEKHEQILYCQIFLFFA